MNIAQLIFNLPAATKYVVRNVEKCKNKLINCQYAAQFNKTCVNENILPNYTNIYIYIHKLQQVHFSQPKTLSIRPQLYLKIQLRPGKDATPRNHIKHKNSFKLIIFPKYKVKHFNFQLSTLGGSTRKTSLFHLHLICSIQNMTLYDRSLSLIPHINYLSILRIVDIVN